MGQKKRERLLMEHREGEIGTGKLKDTIPATSHQQSAFVGLAKPTTVELFAVTLIDSSGSIAY